MVLADVWQSLFYPLAASWLGAERGARHSERQWGAAAAQVLGGWGPLCSFCSWARGCWGSGSPPHPGVVPPAARCFPSQAFSLAGLWGQCGSQASGLRKSAVLPARLPRSTATSPC